VGVGYQVDGAGHREVYKEFYASVIQQDKDIQWVTPALDGEFGNRLLLPWEPDGLAERFVK